MAAKRLYVIHEDGKAIAIVRASSQAQAIAHIVGGRFEAVPADAEHMVALKHLDVQTAGEKDVSL